MVLNKFKFVVIVQDIAFLETLVLLAFVHVGTDVVLTTADVPSVTGTHGLWQLVVLLEQIYFFLSGHLTKRFLRVIISSTNKVAHEPNPTSMQ